MRILVADDEHLTRFTVISILKDMQIDNLDIAEAVSGKDVLDKVKLFRPDGVFLDIRMPGMDGLTAMDSIKKSDKALYERISWFILTGFADFDYARKAIDVGVVNYLLKPVSKDEVASSVKQIITWKQKYEQNVMRIREAELFAFSREESPVEDLPELSRYNVFRASIVIADPVIASSGEEGFNAVSGMGRHLHESVQYLRGLKTAYTLSVFENGTYYILESCVEEKDFASDLQKCIYRDTFFGGKIQTAFIQTHICRSLGEVFTEIETALAYAGTRHFISYNSLRFMDLDHLKTIPFREAGEYLDNLAAAYHLQAASQVRELLSRKVKMNPEIRHNDVFLRNLEKLFCIDNEVSSIEDIFSHISGLVSAPKTAGEVPVLIKRTLEIIESRYKEAIGIVEIADTLKITPNYLSSVFSRAMGIPFTRYLTLKKMKAAQDMLLENGVTVKSVAFNVGYASPKHFTKIFKKIYSMTPGEYKGSHSSLLLEK